MGAVRRMSHPKFGADFAILEEPSFAQVPYRPGHDPVVATFIAGERVA